VTTKKISKMTAVAGECLREAVLEELRKKALLGQHAIIYRDGKSCRIPATEALKIAERK
jgi:hypothetical protein